MWLILFDIKKISKQSLNTNGMRAVASPQIFCLPNISQRNNTIKVEIYCVILYYAVQQIHFY